MRIDRLTLKNFKCFAEQGFDLNPQFTLFVGDNGSGKTSILESLAIAAGSWLLAVKGYETPQIRRQHAMMTAKPIAHDGTLIHGMAITHNSYTWEEHFPCVVSAIGEFLGRHMEWRRELSSASGRTTYKDAKALEYLAQDVAIAAKESDALLPLIACYGTGRLCDIPRDQTSIKDERPFMDKTKMSRFSGYDLSIAPRANVVGLVRWIARQTWISFQNSGQGSAAFDAVRHGVASCVPDAIGIHFDPAIGEVVVDFGDVANSHLATSATASAPCWRWSAISPPEPPL
jgi:predicted ATP-binding protein involved in virulence